MNSHLLIVHFESGDEIHLTVLEISHLSKIEHYLEEIHHGVVDANDLCDYIKDNTLEEIRCQTYVTMDYFNNKYDIKKVIHIAELGY